jgi:hypothetical protein
MARVFALLVIFEKIAKIQLELVILNIQKRAIALAIAKVKVQKMKINLYQVPT